MYTHIKEFHFFSDKMGKLHSMVTSLFHWETAFSYGKKLLLSHCDTEKSSLKQNLVRIVATVKYGDVFNASEYYNVRIGDRDGA